MDDRTFFDTLFQQFARTTGAENTFWAVEEVHRAGASNVWFIQAVAEDQTKTPIAFFEKEMDADFVAGLHGCIPDLVRRLHDALDEADRLDRERDEREVALAILTQEADQLAADHAEAEQNVFRLAVENDELRAEAAQLRRERESWVSRAGDTLWKIERPM